MMPSVYDGDDVASVFAEESVVGDGESSVRDRDRRYHDRTIGLLEQFAEERAANAFVEDDEENESGSTGGSEQQVDSVEAAAALGGLKSLAVRLQKAKRVGMLGMYARGRFVRGSTYRGRPVRYKHYSVSGSIVVDELETAGGLYERLKNGERVVGNILARTAIGKTTKFPAKIVSEAGKRVLLLEPDVRLARYAVEAGSRLVDARKIWAPDMVKYMVSMSYHDFCGQFSGGNGIKMLESFDVVIMDENDADMAVIEACRMILAAYGPSSMSILQLSATGDGRDAQSGGESAQQIEAGVSLRQFVDNGYLFRGAYARDRTMVIANGDRQASEIQKKIYDAGFECMILDSASRFSEVKRVRDFLSQASAVTNRYVVVTPSYGFGYNIPVDSVVTAGECLEYEVAADGRSVAERVWRLSPAQITQHGGRGGREGRAGMSFVVCRSDDGVVEKQGLTFSQRVHVYLLAVACNITVPEHLFPDVLSALMPYGVTKALALDVLAIDLPPEVALRFFAADGRVALNYVYALEPFTMREHRLLASEYAVPVDHDLWATEFIGGYYGGDEVKRGLTVRVPMCADGDLRVVLHAIATNAASLLTVENWVCSSSDTELDVVPRRHNRVSSVHGVYQPRVVEEIVVPELPSVPERMFVYDVPRDQQRGGNLMISSTTAMALSQFSARDVDTGMTDFPVSCSILPEQERGVSRIGILDGGSSAVNDAEVKSVDMRSPGGSVVVSFRQSVWKKMVLGEELIGSDVKSFMNAIKHNIDGFVQSDAFSGWTDVWLSVFKTVANRDNLLLVKSANLIDRLVALLAALVGRYVSAVKAVTNASYVHASFADAMYSGMSYSSALSRQRRKGRVEIQQSEAFFRRLFLLRDSMVVALQGLEREGIFAPSVTTILQTLLPVMRKTGNKVIDAPTSSARSRFLPTLGIGTGSSGGSSSYL